MAGRKALPTKVQEAKGAYSVHPSRKNKSEPRPQDGWPAIPEVVENDSAARDKWFETCRLLSDMNVLTVADANCIAQLCLAHSQQLACWEVVKGGNIKNMDDKGKEWLKPEAKDFHVYSDRIIRCCVELGLTPSARTRIKVIEPKQDDEFLNWLGATEN